MDLFEQYEALPAEIKAAINKFNEDGNLYEECGILDFKITKLGYKMEWGLDGIPYNLRKEND